MYLPTVVSSYKPNIFLTALLVCLGSMTFATHDAGSDISYRCIDTLKYEVTYRIYRACAASQMSFSTQFTLRSSSSNTPLQLSPTLISISDITQICDTVSKPCSPTNTSESGNGFELFILRDTVDFSAHPFDTFIGTNCTVYFEYSRCCRNTDITGTNVPYYNFAMLNLCLAKWNTSPEFLSNPKIWYPIYQPSIENPGVAERSDHDSISFGLGSVLRDWEDTSTYFGHPKTQLTWYNPSGAGFINPNANPPVGFYFDEKTGQFVFTPMQYNTGYFVFEIREWRKQSDGTFAHIGTVRQDKFFFVRATQSNNPPVYFGTLDNVGKDFYTCAGDTFCYQVNYTDYVKIPPPPAKTPPSDFVQLDWNHGIPEAEFGLIDSSAKQQKGRICWHPQEKDISTTPYQATFIATDNNCPFNSASSIPIRVYVFPKPQGELQFSALRCGRTALSAANINSSENFPISLFWDVLDSSGNTLEKDPFRPQFAAGKYPSQLAADTIRFFKNGQYILRLRLKNQGGETTLYDTLSVLDVVELPGISDTSICCYSSLQLDSLNDFAGSNWSATYPAILNNGLVTSAFGCDSTYHHLTIKLHRQSTDKLCSDSLSIDVAVTPVPTVKLGDFERCVSSGPMIIDTNLIKTNNPDLIDPAYLNFSCSNCIEGEFDKYINQNPFSILAPFAEKNTLQQFNVVLETDAPYGCSYSDSATWIWIGSPEIDRSVLGRDTTYYTLCTGEESVILEHSDTLSYWQSTRLGLLNNPVQLDTMPHGEDTLLLVSKYQCGTDTVILNFVPHIVGHIVPRDTSIVSTTDQTVFLESNFGSSTIIWHLQGFGILDEDTGINNILFIPENLSDSLQYSAVTILFNPDYECQLSSDTTIIEIRPSPCTPISTETLEFRNIRLSGERSNLTTYTWILPDGTIDSEPSTTLDFNPTFKGLVELITTTSFGDSCRGSVWIDFTSVLNPDYPDFALYPNPVDGLLKIVGIDDLDHSGVSFQITDLVGQKVLSGITFGLIDCRPLNPGMYHLTILQNGYIITKPFIRNP